MKKLTRDEMKNVLGGLKNSDGTFGCACTSSSDCSTGWSCSTVTLPCGPNGEERNACVRD